MKKTLVGAAICAALIFGSSGAAFAGEVNGNGDPTGGPGHARSLCVYSGLEDGEEGGEAGPGNVQNWGHVPQELRKQWSSRGASYVSVPGEGNVGCNPHSVGGE
ncbi:hypothetical protein SAMN04487846_1332 [Microbacterium sp. cf046]|uniref:hypothetical protein n=1 Tax=Microbacterium sp. cf046 TaxID=1761803 RepID=UPI0008E20BC5|nr:hypothetical protein [Microbacterium sp. cf046]SFS00005.1 hypothetical protein SAMN04487846_1332 [Microbacterium sp. cf046]